MNKMYFLCAVGLLVLFTHIAHAQQSGSNLQSYTPSILFGKGQWEFKNFNNLYTQTQHFSPEGGKETTGRGRETYVSYINQFLYGVSGQINVGMDLWVKSVYVESTDREDWTAVTGIGPKIKIAPFKQLPRLSIQSTLLFPLAGDLEGGSMPGDQAFLEHDRTLWINQLFYDLPLSDDFQLFFQQAFWYAFVRESFRENNYLQTPLSGFFNYFPNNRLTIYAMTEYWPTHYNTNEQKGEAFYSYFVQSGGGVKYQVIPGLLEGELLYTNFWMGSDFEGAGETFNIGIRIIH